ncbi:hypothetical protein EYF80_043967 [Liparis tanakae]|uniref:Uncharacterized protein n=1 Tax=Liparis tanakae TaxID=230148 RepID=A0A4Z2FZQ1_9TELE|nr:hypothetical protein EYF80_043967 [Liparis tanakae]
MVKAEDALDMADDWKEVFERSRVIPPPGQTARLAADHHLTQPHGFQLGLSRLTAAHLPQVTHGQERWCMVERSYLKLK